MASTSILVLVVVYSICLVYPTEAQLTDTDAGTVSVSTVLEQLVLQLRTLETKLELEKRRTDLLEATLAEKMSLSPAGAVTYIRWGRTTCGSNASVVHSGYAAGPRWSDTGSGSNFLCLPSQPQWKNVLNGVEVWTGKLYGVEYELSITNNVFSFSNNGGETIWNRPAPCALCLVKTRSAYAMIPARVDCPPGWTKEYSGYLMSSSSVLGHRGSSYVCVDEAPEISTVGSWAQEQSYFYPVEVGCGSLNCSSYVNGWELTCVVCTI